MDITEQVNQKLQEVYERIVELEKLRDAGKYEFVGEIKERQEQLERLMVTYQKINELVNI